MDDQKSTLLQTPWDAVQAGGFPLLVWLAAALFLAGLISEIVILTTLVRGGASGISSRFSHVTQKPWGLGEVGLIAATLCALLLIGSLMLGWLEHYGSLTADSLRQVQLLTSIIVIDGFGLLAILLLLCVERIGLRDAFGMRLRTIPGAFGTGLFCLVAVIPPVWVVAQVSESLCEQFQIPVEPQEMAQLFLHSDSFVMRMAIASMAVVVAPLFEETFFRGLAYPALKQKIGFVPSLLVTSLVFAAIHFHALSFLPLCVLAVGLTLAYEATGNLTVPIVMHSLFNLMSILIMAMVPT